MVLGQVRPLLEVDERVAVWAHVHAPGGSQPGLLSLTTARCLVHWGAGEEPAATFRWSELTAWQLAPREGGATVLTLVAGRQVVEVRLLLTTDARARTAVEIVEHVAGHAPDAAGMTATGSARELAAEPRGLREHARRIGVTLAGLLVVLVSLVFASPFVPGPGALTFLAGLAILAKEYDWARDVHRFVRRKFEQLWSWMRERREHRRRPRGRRRGEVRDLAEVRRRGVGSDRVGTGWTDPDTEADVRGPADAQAQ